MWKRNPTGDLEYSAIDLKNCSLGFGNIRRDVGNWLGSHYGVPFLFVKQEFNNRGEAGKRIETIGNNESGFCRGMISVPLGFIDIFGFATFGRRSLHTKLARIVR